MGCLRQDGGIRLWDIKYFVTTWLIDRSIDTTRLLKVVLPAKDKSAKIQCTLKNFVLLLSGTSGLWLWSAIVYPGRSVKKEVWASPRCALFLTTWARAWDSMGWRCLYWSGRSWRENASSTSVEIHNLMLLRFLFGSEHRMKMLSKLRKFFQCSRKVRDGCGNPL